MDKEVPTRENQGMEQGCIIYVFSGTGNTMMVAEEYRKALGIRTEIVSIMKDFQVLPSPDGYSLVGIGYPVHAFNTPLVVHKFASWLKEKDGKDLFIFHTGGEGLKLNDSSSKGIRKILKGKFRILSERHYVMPYNMIFRHSDRMVKHMVTYMKAIVPIHAKAIMDGIEEKAHPMPIRILISAILRIEWIYANIQGKYMKANDSCNGCSLCARMCPMGNIKMVNGKPVFVTECILCVRCSFSCPRNAISIGLLEGWKVNGPYHFRAIMADDSIPDTIAIKDLPVLYRPYYRRAIRLLSR